MARSLRIEYPGLTGMIDCGVNLELDS